MLGPTRPNQCRGAAWCASSQTFAGQPPIRRGSVIPGEAGALTIFSQKETTTLHLFTAFCADMLHTVDGSEIRRENQLIWRIYRYLQGFIHVGWCRISSINTRRLKKNKAANLSQSSTNHLYIGSST